jgi:hypothetical protein
MDLREIRYEGINQTELTQDRIQWQAFVNKLTNLWVPEKQEIS